MLCLDSKTNRQPMTAWVMGILMSTFACVAGANPSLLKGQDELLQQMRKWVSTSQSVPIDFVFPQPMDHRIKVENCQTAVQFDHPFTNKQTVRARCDQPTWQYYLQVSVRGVEQSPLTPASTQGQVIKQVFVSSGMLKRGTALQAGMLKATEISMPASENTIIRNEKDLLHMELVRDLPANTPIRSYDIKPSTMVKRGQQVTVSIGEGKGFLISIRAEALQDGQIGEQIKLKNTESGRLLSAVVTGSNMARGI